MLRVLMILFAIIAITIAAFLKGAKYNVKGKSINYAGNSLSPKGIRIETRVSLGKYRNGIIAYTIKHQLNTRYCFLIDMKLASGLKRFYVYDLKYDTVLLAGLVTHGSSNHVTDSVLFSNTPGSNCTSLGKYKIGKSYRGKFGLAYKLYGLDKTNSNAFNRFVVLHSHSCVPENEIAPGEICRSWGCPTVAPVFLAQLKNVIEKSPAPIMLWIYN